MTSRKVPETERSTSSSLFPTAATVQRPGFTPIHPHWIQAGGFKPRESKGSMPPPALSVQMPSLMVPPISSWGRRGPVCGEESPQDGGKMPTRRASWSGSTAVTGVKADGSHVDTRPTDALTQCTRKLSDIWKPVSMCHESLSSRPNTRPRHKHNTTQFCGVGVCTCWLR